MTSEQRLMRAYRRIRRAQERRRASAPLSEAELFEAHGMTLPQVLSVLASIPRRPCPCASHGDAR